MGTWAWLLPPWAVIVHRGRRSGRRYRTPVFAVRSDGRLVVVPLYGEQSDWLRNVLAAGRGEVTRLGRTHPLTNPRLVEADRAGLGPLARLLARPVDRVFLADLG
jgi:deazaflavin-dependent oxidoreductase (nitroreductase family)